VNRYKKISELTDDFLKEGWAAEHTAEGDDAVILESYTESLADTWTATQIWGFAEVQGERRHVRRILAEKEGKTERIRLVYNYQGE
jgi:pyruvoyl-dependent arginine decarboxylase (PvlArgDC)